MKKELLRNTIITFLSLIFVSGLIMITCFVGLTMPVHLIGIAMIAVGGFGLWLVD